MNVKVKSFKEFRILTKLSYQMGYRFFSGKKHNPFLMWIGLVGLNPIHGIWYEDYENSKRIKFCDYSNWDNHDYIEFSEFMLMLEGEI